MKSLYNILLATLFIVSISSCKKKEITTEDTTTNTESTNTKTLIKIGETYLVGAKTKAVLYSEKSVETGYNEFYTALFDSIDGSSLSSGDLVITPMMDMGSMKHSSPVENDASGLAKDGYFKSAVVFSMAGTASQWSLNFSFHNSRNNLNGQGSIALSVSSGTPSKFKSTVLALDSNSTIFLSLISPKKPQVGMNDFEVVLHTKKSGMEYIPAKNYRIEIVPEMPSMGHGSPNNVNPVHTSSGHYIGKVNFTMTGLWNVKVKLFKNDVLVSSDQYFELTLN